MNPMDLYLTQYEAILKALIGTASVRLFRMTDMYWKNLDKIWMIVTHL